MPAAAQDIMKPLAKAYAQCKDVATVPVLKVVLKELATQIGVQLEKPVPRLHEYRLLVV